MYRPAPNLSGYRVRPEVSGEQSERRNRPERNIQLLNAYLSNTLLMRQFRSAIRKNWR
jgi:hypothetical protein